MSKRARITLNLDPEPESEPGMKTTPGAEPADASVVKPKPRPKAEPRVKSERKPSPAPATKSEPAPRSEPKPAEAAAENPQSRPEPATQTRAASSPGEQRVQTEKPAPAQPRSDSVDPGSGKLNLGTVFKVALVGLVVVSAILLLKRKP